MRKIKKVELLRSFERLCSIFNVISAGFDPEKITCILDGAEHDGKERWAMKYVHKEQALKNESHAGWIIVSGWKGCAIPFAYFNGYISGRWNFLQHIEGLAAAAQKMRREKNQPMQAMRSS